MRGRPTLYELLSETWNLKVLAVGSGAVLSESPGQENQILYSLTRDGGRWWILSRIRSAASLTAPAIDDGIEPR